MQTNAFFAHVGGVSLRLLNAMELAFLELLDFEVHISIDEYRDTLEATLSHSGEMPSAQRETVVMFLQSAPKQLNSNTAPSKELFSACEAECTSTLTSSCSSQMDELA
jgi:hypothetical protein